MALYTNTSVLFSFPPLYAYASVSMPPSRTASGVIFVAWGKGKDGIRNSNFLSKNLHALSGVVFCLKNLLILLPNLWEVLETKTTNAVGRRHKKISDIQRGEKKKKPPTPNPNKIINNLEIGKYEMILSDIRKVLWKALSAYPVCHLVRTCMAFQCMQHVTQHQHIPCPVFPFPCIRQFIAHVADHFILA